MFLLPHFLTLLLTTDIHAYQQINKLLLISSMVDKNDILKVSINFVISLNLSL